ncbi:MAG: glycosyltransferase family 4 protein, partial [Candidatus Binatia bacterium]
NMRPSKVRVIGWLLSDLFVDIFPGVLQISRIIRQEKIDIIHLNNHLGFDLDGIIAAKLCGIACVVHQRGFGRVSRLTRFLSRYVEVLICISGAVRRHYALEGILPKRVVRIYDGIDISSTIPSVVSKSVRCGLAIEDKGPIVGIIGTIQPWKGQREVILAIKQVREIFPDIRCLIVGEIFDPSYDRQIKALVDELELQENIRYLGYRKDVLELMDGMDIVIHASTSPEPFGRVLIEAMVLGKPVIATKAGGPLEIVEDTVTGLLVPPGDPEALASAVIGLFENQMHSAKMGEAGRERVRKMFSLSHTIEETEKIYAQL